MNRLDSKVQVLNREEMQLIHETGLKILDEVGYRFSHPVVLDWFEKAGAQVDRQAEIVHLPHEMVKETIAYARRQIHEPDGQPKRISAAIASEAFIVDCPGKVRRSGTREDVLKGIVLGNALPNIRTVFPVVTIAEVPAHLVDVVNFQLLYTHSRKPCNAWIFSRRALSYIWRMAEIVHGDRRAVQVYLNAISPLTLDHANCEMALYCMEHGLSFDVGPFMAAGISGPLTPAGALALNNAETLALGTLCRLAGQPYGLGGSPLAADMRTTIQSFGLPLNTLMGIAGIQISNFYGLPGGAGLGLTDACHPDFQAGFEMGASAMATILAGEPSVGMRGIVGADQAISLEQLVLDDEWMEWINYVLAGFEVNEDTLAYETIKTVGPGGHFLGEPHTAKWARRLQPDPRPGVFNREAWEGWTGHGGKDAYERAHDRVQTILAEGYPPQPVIAPALVEQLEAIVAEAYADTGDWSPV